MLIIRENTKSFIEKYIKHTSKITSRRGFVEIPSKIELDAYIVGSDQCWRPCYNRFLEEMFLSFDTRREVKRIAYAASFGSDEWEYNYKQTEKCNSLAQKFDLITVREKSAVFLCKQYLDVEAQHVSDPTMLLSKEDYVRLVEGENIPKSRGSLFNYVLDPTEKIKNIIDNISTKTGYTSFQVLPKYNEDHWTKDDVKKRITDCIYPSPLEWVRAFMDAQLIVVDSFHGAVFSIIFNKPFWVIGNKERGMTRFTSLLETFGLQERLITESEFSCLDDYLIPIDWEPINAIIKKSQDKSLNLLNNALKIK